MDNGSDLRLVERDSKMLSEGVKYCALSYCWGQQTGTLTTRKENVAQHLVAMFISSFPQVSMVQLQGNKHLESTLT